MSNEYLMQLDNSSLGYVIGLFFGFFYILSNEFVQVCVLKIFRYCNRWVLKKLFNRTCRKAK